MEFLKETVNKNNLDIKVGDNTNRDNVISPEIVVKIKDFYIDAFKDDLADGFFDEAGIDKKVEGEKSFYLDILNSVDKAKEENEGKEIITLFDLDETLVRNKWKRDNTIATIIRPSALILLDAINKKNASCGFLTSRFNIKEQLDSNLKEFKSLINETYLLSTKGFYIEDEEKQQIKEKLPDDLRKPFNDGDYQKLIYFNNLIKNKENTDKVFIAIDDFIWPSLTKYGKSLEDNEMFTV